MAKASLTIYEVANDGERTPITLTIETGRGTTITDRVPLVIGGPTA